MRGLARARWLAGAAVLALAVTACGGGNGDDPADPADPADTAEEGEEGEDAEPMAGGTFRSQLGEPASLVPANTNETEGGEVLGALYSALLEFDAETGELMPMVATEIPTSEDNITWTFDIADGWTFHNGEAVTAQSFVDAWNFAAFGPNAQGNSYFFGPGMADVVGFADVQSGEDPDGEEGAEEAPAPASETMSGLVAVDDSTLEVTLNQPFSQFPLMVAYTAFYPMAADCIADPDACNEAPIGNGPFAIEGTWNHDIGINAVRYEEWAGPRQPNIDGIEWQIFSDPTTAYLALQDGTLDLAGIPPDQLAQAEGDLGDRLIEQPSSTFTYIGLPCYNPTYGVGGEEGCAADDERAPFRQALSLAIDRQELIDTVFNGAFTPADSLVSPVVEGYREGACEVCTFDPEQAATLFEESGGLEALGGPIQIWFNDGAAHDVWMQAVGNYWAEHLGIEYELQAQVWAEYLTALGEQQITGPWRLGWVMDYPSAQNYLAPIYGPGGGGENFGYNNEDVNALYVEGNSAASVEEGLEFYNQAEDLILADFPAIPVYFGQTIAGQGEDVANLTIDQFGFPDYVGAELSGN